MDKLIEEIEDNMTGSVIDIYIDGQIFIEDFCIDTDKDRLLNLKEKHIYVDLGNGRTIERYV